MDNATCLFCGHGLDGRSKKFCTTCLPPYGQWDDHRGYMGRYNFLQAAVGHGRPDQASCARSRLPKGHPALPVPMAVHLPECGYRECTEPVAMGKCAPLAYCSRLCKHREKYERQIDCGQQVRLGGVSSGVCRWCFQDYRCEVNGNGGLRKQFCSNDCLTKARGHIKTHRSPNSCPLPVCIDCCQVFGASPLGTGRWSDGNRCADCLKTNGDNTSRRHAARRIGDRPTIAKLAERDGAVCGLCSGPVDMALKGTDWLGPTVDHIVPLSLGGTDTMDNTQLTHRSCNVRRNVKPVEEFQPCPESSQLFAN